MKDQEKMIFKKLSAVMKEIGAVEKNQENTAQKYRFRGIDQFMNALYPALVNNGVFIVPSLIAETHDFKQVVRANGRDGMDKHVHVQMRYTFYAEDGSSLDVGPIPGEGIDSGDKATNKALSAALKYALIQTFSIPTEDNVDADEESPELAPVKAHQSTPHTVLTASQTGLNPTPAPRPTSSPSVRANVTPITGGTALKASPNKPASEKQRKMLFALSKEKGIPEVDLKSYIQTVYGKTSTSELTSADASEMIDLIQKGQFQIPKVNEPQHELGEQEAMFDSDVPMDFNNTPGA
jgi:hypothetical protein